MFQITPSHQAEFAFTTSLKPVCTTYIHTFNMTVASTQKRDVLHGVLFFWSKQNTWPCSNGGRGFTLFMVFYLLDIWLKSCSSQIPFIPQRTTSYHIFNYPLVPCLMCIWKAHFTQVRNVDIHLVAKFGNGLEVKFVRTPHR
jgi:hypothetical protein